MNKLQLHKVQMNFTNMILSQRSQIQEYILNGSDDIKHKNRKTNLYH